MTTKAAIKAQSLEAQRDRLLEQCEHADSFRFEVPTAPSITFHLDPDGRGNWAITRFGWVTPMALTEDGWEPLGEVLDSDRFIWTVTAALAQVPGFLEGMSTAHAEWQAEHAKQQAAERAAERARAMAAVTESAVSATKEFVAAATGVAL